MVRKVNKSLKDWVSFVKKVQKEEKLEYKDAIARAKVRKDGGETWMSGGNIPQQVGTGNTVHGGVPPPQTAPGGGQSMRLPNMSATLSINDIKMQPIKGGRKQPSRKQKKTAKKQKRGKRTTCSKK